MPPRSIYIMSWVVGLGYRRSLRMTRSAETIERRVRTLHDERILEVIIRLVLTRLGFDRDVRDMIVVLCFPNGTIQNPDMRLRLRLRDNKRLRLKLRLRENKRLRLREVSQSERDEMSQREKTTYQ